MEYDGSGMTGNTYIHGPGIDEPLALVTGKRSYYYHADGLGSIVALTDETAQVVQEYEYDSFGNLHDQKNRIKQPYTYTAREWDKEAGLYYYRARYYDAEVGRFISEDPIGFEAGDTNFYAYVSNHVINLSDPLGLFSADDFWRAWENYCSGGKFTWSTTVSSVDWGNTKSEIYDIIKVMANNCDKNASLPVNFPYEAAAGGTDANIIGNHNLKVTGEIKRGSGCDWTFNGEMKSDTGVDYYNFNPADRGPWGEFKAFIGRSRCPFDGETFSIYLFGSEPLFLQGSTR